MTNTPTLATSYHEGYIDGIKIALEFIEMADNKDRAAEALTRMIKPLTPTEE